MSDLNKSRGYAVETNAEGQIVRETQSFTCAHCNGVSFKKPENVCRKCMRHICDGRECNTVCMPFEKKCELVEKIKAQELRDAFRKSMGL